MIKKLKINKKIIDIKKVQEIAELLVELFKKEDEVLTKIKKKQ